VNRNSEEKQRVGTFEDLTVYQAARAFRKAMYRVAKELPEIEKFGLVSQIRRAALPLTNNIAEGHGRFHYLEQIKFLFQARGSLQELIDDLNACEDEKYLTTDRIQALKQESWRIRQLIDGYIGYLRNRKTADSKVREDSPLDSELTSDPTNYDSTNYQLQ
jgi:four helix bundle protein